ncbi:bacterio-opsin activator domain-containing protein [Natronobacterium gregoryi]
MATEATFTLPADRFPLGSVFEQLPDATIELERVIPSRDALVPYFWVRGVETDGIEEFFADQPEIRRIELVDSVEDEHLLRVEWASDHDGILLASCTRSPRPTFRSSKRSAPTHSGRSTFVATTAATSFLSSNAAGNWTFQLRCGISIRSRRPTRPSRRC